MRNNRSAKKKKKKDRTWAEAAAMALQMTAEKRCNVRRILEIIFEKNLKDISMNRAAENVLTTMLNHHAQLPNCPFFRVKDCNGIYALKEYWMRQNGETLPSTNANKNACNEEGNDQVQGHATIKVSSGDKVVENEGMINRGSHTYSIHGKTIEQEEDIKVNDETELNKKNHLLLQAAHLSSRRHSSPVALRYNPTRSSSNQHPTIVTRANSLTTRYGSLYNHNSSNQSPKNISNLDLETPSSILVNANMRALVNKETFFMLPSSYRYQLTQLLPACDQTLASVGHDAEKILTLTDTALTNEFFTQAVQEWRERLHDGEFTRETQSRIVQEIAKERSKIDPWKEKFFEDYYGQKQVPEKRLRSRSQNLAAETGHKMRDLGMEAQLALFVHLREELDKKSDAASSDDDPLVSDEVDDFFKPRFPRKLASRSNARLHSLSVSNSLKKMSYAERIAKTKLANSRISAKLRNNKINPVLFRSPIPSAKQAQERLKVAIASKTPPAAASAIIMKPSWSLSAFSRVTNKNPSNDENSDSDENSKKVLNVQKRSDDGLTADHSYTSAPWHQVPSSSSSSNRLSVNPTTSTKSPTMLVLCPSGNLVNSIANMKKDGQAINQQSDVKSSDDDVQHLTGSEAPFNAGGRMDVAMVKPAVHVISSTSTSSDTERVLSLCARPLTPESFVSGATKPVGVITIKQVQSPLSIDAQAASPSDRNSKFQPRHEVENKSDSSLKPRPPPPQKSTTESPLLTPTTAVVTNPQHALYELSGNAAHSRLPATTSMVGTLAPSHLSSPSRSFSNGSIASKPSGPPLPSNHAGYTVLASTPTRHFTPHPIYPPQATPLVVGPTISSSPVVRGRFSLAGAKRPFPSPSRFPTPSPPTRWSSSSSPIKKTRTLAEIKAQIKAKRASNIRPVVSQQPPSVPTNTSSHVFSATTFPVYFPMAANSTAIVNNTRQMLPGTASYIRLPNTATLPLEKVHWVSHQMAHQSATSQEYFNHSEAMTCKAMQASVQPSCNMSAVTSSSSENILNPQKSGKGKITLKIKAAGSAISLKVDADVIKKEMKRSSYAPPSDDDDASSEDSNSDTSDVGRPRAVKHRHGPIRLPKVVQQSSGSDSDIEKPVKRRWSASGIDTGQLIKKSGTSQLISSGIPPSTAPLLPVQPPPVFGVPPFNVSVKPSSLTSDETKENSSKNMLFPSKPLFTNPTSSSWTNNTASFVNKPTLPDPQLNTSTKYRSTSKGKSLQNMQDLARSNMLHTDDSADEDTSEDDDHADSAFSTTTASENEKCSDSEDDLCNTRIRNQTTNPQKRITRSSASQEDSNKVLLSSNNSNQDSNFKS